MIVRVTAGAIAMGGTVVVANAVINHGQVLVNIRFTIPNFPSRFLSYMQNSMTVLADTDPKTDVAKVIEEELGWWCESNDSEGVISKMDEVCRIGDISKKAEMQWSIYGRLILWKSL